MRPFLISYTGAACREQSGAKKVQGRTFRQAFLTCRSIVVQQVLEVLSFYQCDPESMLWRFQGFIDLAFKAGDCLNPLRVIFCTLVKN